MAIDGFFIRNLIKENENNLKDFRIEKINQATNDIFTFSLYLKGVRNFLNFKLKPPYPSFFITKKPYNKESYNSSFLVNLKKQLTGYKIVSIDQHKLDRVIIFKLSGVDLLKGKINKYLYLELMGRYNNLILTNDNNIIIDAYFKNVSYTKRSVVPNSKYEFFNTSKKDFDLSNYDNMDSPTYLTKNFIGISPLLSNYLFNNKIDIFNTKIKPVKSIKNNNFYWFDLFDESTSKKYYDNLSNLLIDLIKSRGIDKTIYENFINKELVSLKRKLNNLKNDLKKANNNLILKDYGNYIYSSGENLNNRLTELKTYDNKIIKLDYSKTLLENAKIFFKKYSKAKRAINYINEQILINENLYNTFLEFEYDLENIKDDFSPLEESLKPYGFKRRNKNIKKIVKKENYLTINYKNYTFYIGRNSKENAFVTHKLANSNDYWFHVKDLPGSHVLIKEELNDENLNIASMLALYYSKGKDSLINEVNYTKKKYIKTIKNQPLSQVYLTKYKSINVKLDKSLINEILLANKLK